MTHPNFSALAHNTLTQIDNLLGELDPDRLDVELAGDVMNLCFSDGSTFVLNSHRAAGQIWLAAGTSAWHFDPPTASHQDPLEGWIASKTSESLRQVLGRVVGEKLSSTVTL